jgi:hypothetical protein
MRFSLALIAGWALIGAGACGVTFIISTIPPAVGFGRTIPLPLDIIEAVLAVGMLTFCTAGPVLLMMAGRAYLRSTAHDRGRWVTAWTAAASTSLAIEALFLVRFVHMLESSYPNLPYPSWHALDFAVGYLVDGAVLASVLIIARKSVGRTKAA